MSETEVRPFRVKNKLVLGAVFTATLALLGIVFVLPAEFAIDPTGFGAATGLNRISDPGLSLEQKRGALRKGVLTLTDRAVNAERGNSDHFEIELQPYTGIELKYEVAAGKAFSFRWHAAKSLHYDMHAHPFKGGSALTESYAVGDSPHQQGRYVAAFTGIHGWFWQNRSLEPVRLILDAKGALLGSRTFDSMGENARELTPS